jgi:hypothetical protein
MADLVIDQTLGALRSGSAISRAPDLTFLDAI